MKNTKSKLLGIAALGLGALLLSSCTANFCSAEDRAAMLYPYEQGVTVYCAKEDVDAYKLTSAYTSLTDEDKAIFDSLSGQAIEGNENVYKYVPFTRGTSYPVFAAQKASFINSLIVSASNSGYVLPSVQYWAEVDNYVLANAVKKLQAEFPEASVSAITVNTVSTNVWAVNPYTEIDTDGKDAHPIELNLKDKNAGNSLLRYYGEDKFYKFNGDKYLEESNLAAWIKEMRASTKAGLGLDGTINNDFLQGYRSQVLANITTKKSCIATKTDTFGHYGSSSDWEIAIKSKDWGYAWSKGFLEGLLVYPIAWLIDTFAYGMDPTLSGVGQILSIIFVAIIVRMTLMLLTLRSQIGQQKMQALQPQVAKIQSKYPNANTNQAEKTRMNMEIQALYKRNKISMFGPFIGLILQFPIFICVWDAMNGSAALSTGAFLNLRLSDPIRDVLFNVSGAWYTNVGGWWTALVLYLLMAVAQIAAVLVPNIIRKHNQKKVEKLYKNANQESQNKTMKWMTYGMVGFTLIMGFTLPSAMGVYWFIGAIISLSQNLITQAVVKAKNKNKGVR